MAAVAARASGLLESERARAEDVRCPSTASFYPSWLSSLQEQLGALPPPLPLPQAVPPAQRTHAAIIMRSALAAMRHILIEVFLQRCPAHHVPCKAKWCLLCHM